MEKEDLHLHGPSEPITIYNEDELRIKVGWRNGVPTVFVSKKYDWFAFTDPDEMRMAAEAIAAAAIEFEQLIKETKG